VTDSEKWHEVYRVLQDAGMRNVGGQDNVTRAVGFIRWLASKVDIPRELEASAQRGPA